MVTRDHAEQLAELIADNQGSLAEIWSSTALDLYQKGFFEGAADAFSKAKDTYTEENPEYSLLEEWQQDAEEKVGSVHDTDAAMVESDEEGSPEEEAMETPEEEAEEEEEEGETPEEEAAEGEEGEEAEELEEEEPDYDEIEYDYDDVLKSMLITKHDVPSAAGDLSELLDTYGGEYAGNYISLALDMYEKGLFEDAAESFEKARDSFMPEDNPDEWNLLDKWANDAYARSLAVTDVETGSDTLEAVTPPDVGAPEPSMEELGVEEPAMDEIRDIVSEESDRLMHEYVDEEKSLVEKADAGAGEPDSECMKTLWQQYYKYFSGKWIAAAQKLKSQGNYEAAAKAYQKAANGFEPNKNPKEHGCLRSWAEYCIKKAGKDVSILDNLP